MTVIPGRNWKQCLCKILEGIYKVYYQGLYENGEHQKLLGPSASTFKIIGFLALEKRGKGAVHCTLNNRPWRGEGLPIMVYTERLRPNRSSLSGFRFIKGWEY